MKIEICKARPEDAARLAELCGQLGYPTTRRELSKRLRLVLRNKDGGCFVAKTKPGGRVVGWIHVSSTPLLEMECCAEVKGLVVDEDGRSEGTGLLLLKAAEQWARRYGCQSMSVRSNVIRERAHTFYQRNGYEHYKTQKAFRKKL